MPEAIYSILDSFLFHSIEHFSIPPGVFRHQPLHRHPDTAELLLVTEGHIHCKIGAQSHSLPAGAALLVPPGSWHELAYPAAQQQSGYRLSVTLPHRAPSDQAAAVPQVTRLDDLTGVVPLFARLQRENDQPRPDSRITHHLIGLIVALLARSADTQYSRNSRDVEATIRLIKHYMEEHHCRALSLNDLAAHFTINKYRLARLFKQQIGMSPLQYLISCRIDTAKQLLATTDSHAAAIASAVGYKSAPQFQAAFKKLAGTTPRQYRLDSTRKL